MRPAAPDGRGENGRRCPWPRQGRVHGFTSVPKCAKVKPSSGLGKGPWCGAQSARKLIIGCEREHEVRFQDNEKKWQDIWDEEKTFAAKQDFSPSPSTMRWWSSPTPPARACTWAIRAATPRWTSWRARSAWRAITCCIPWAGTPSACPPRTMPLKTTSTPRWSRKNNVARFKSQLKSLGLSFDWDAGDQHHRPQLLQMDPVDLSAAFQTGPCL